MDRTKLTNDYFVHLRLTDILNIHEVQSILLKFWYLAFCFDSTKSGLAKKITFQNCFIFEMDIEQYQLFFLRINSTLTKLISSKNINLILNELDTASSKRVTYETFGMHYLQLLGNTLRKINENNLLEIIRRSYFSMTTFKSQGQVLVKSVNEIIAIPYEDFFGNSLHHGIDGDDGIEVIKIDEDGDDDNEDEDEDSEQQQLQKTLSKSLHNNGSYVVTKQFQETDRLPKLPDSFRGGIGGVNQNSKQLSTSRQQQNKQSLQQENSHEKFNKSDFDESQSAAARDISRYRDNLQPFLGRQPGSKLSQQQQSPNKQQQLTSSQLDSSQQQQQQQLQQRSSSLSQSSHQQQQQQQLNPSQQLYSINQQQSQRGQGGESNTRIITSSTNQSNKNITNIIDSFQPYNQRLHPVKFSFEDRQQSNMNSTNLAAGMESNIIQNQQQLRYTAGGGGGESSSSKRRSVSLSNNFSRTSQQQQQQQQQVPFSFPMQGVGAGMTMTATNSKMRERFESKIFAIQENNRTRNAYKSSFSACYPIEDKMKKTQKANLSAFMLGGYEIVDYSETINQLHRKLLRKIVLNR